MHAKYLQEIRDDLDHFKTTNPKVYEGTERDLQKIVVALRYEKEREMKRLAR